MPPMFRSLIVGCALALAASAPAFAATSNLSGTVTTTPPNANFTVSNTANAVGGTDSTYMSITNTSPNQSGTWTISASISPTALAGSLLSLTFYVQSSTSSNMTAVLNRIQFIDSNGNTATLNTIGMSMTPATSAATSFTHNSNLSAYTTSGSFDFTLVNAIQFDIALTAGGNNRIYQLDAVDITSNEIPEPATIGLFAIGALGLGFVARRRARERAGRGPPKPA